MALKKDNIGTTLDSFLEEEGMRKEADLLAQKRVIAFKLARAMEEGGISKSEMARRMRTSAASLNRVLDPNDPGIRLETLSRAAHAAGRELRIEFV